MMTLRWAMAEEVRVLKELEAVSGKKRITFIAKMRSRSGGTLNFYHALRLAIYTPHDTAKRGHLSTTQTTHLLYRR